MAGVEVSGPAVSGPVESDEVTMGESHEENRNHKSENSPEREPRSEDQTPWLSHSRFADWGSVVAMRRHSVVGLRLSCCSWLVMCVWGLGYDHHVSEASSPDIFASTACSFELVVCHTLGLAQHDPGDDIPWEFNGCRTRATVDNVVVQITGILSYLVRLHVHIRPHVWPSTTTVCIVRPINTWSMNVLMILNS